MQQFKWIALGFSAICLIAVAGVSRSQHLYYMAAILLCLPGVSYLMGWYALRGLEFTRVLPSIAWDGQEAVLKYVVCNRSRVSRYFLTIHERFPDWIVPVDAEPPLFNVEATADTQVLQSVTFRKRGLFTVDGFTVVATDPLGVFAFSKHVTCAGEILVYPQPVPLETMPLCGSDRYGWQEFVSVMLHGASVDPDGVRPYVSGDPLRHIHWRQTARTARLSVIEFEEALAVNLAVVLDARRGTDIGTGANTTLEYSVRLAASVAEEAIRQGATVQLIVPLDSMAPDAHQDVRRASGRDQTHLYGILDTLARIEAKSELRVSELLQHEVSRTTPGTALLVITSDLDPDLAPALLRHTANGAQVDVVYIDAATFQRSGTGRGADQPDHFVADLLGASAHVFRVPFDPEGRLLPEEMSYAAQRI